MIRTVASMLCAAVAFAAFAAPAPVYRTPKASEVWVKGWDQPTDPVGDCRFDRKGETLTIVVPPRRNRWITGVLTGAATQAAPHMLRDVRGDFDVQVRLRGDFDGPGPFLSAGLLLKIGKHMVLLQRECMGRRGKGPHFLRSQVFKPILPSTWDSDPKDRDVRPKDRTSYLRIERRGGGLVGKVSLDGTNWEVLMKEDIPGLPREAKLGVFAQATNATNFEPVFDQFKLTPLK